MTRAQRDLTTLHRTVQWHDQLEKIYCHVAIAAHRLTYLTYEIKNAQMLSVLQPIDDISFPSFSACQWACIGQAGLRA